MIKPNARTLITIALVFLLCGAATYALSAGQSRVSVDSRGVREEIEALKGRMNDLEVENTALKETNMILKEGVLFLTSWTHTQLSSKLIEAQAFGVGRGIWVCDLDSPTGDRLEDRDVYVNESSQLALELEARMLLLQP